MPALLQLGCRVPVLVSNVVTTAGGVTRDGTAGTAADPCVAFFSRHW
jgi:hypothetical protein